MKEYAITLSKLKKMLESTEDVTLHGMLEDFISEVSDEYEMQKETAKDFKVD